MSPKEIEDLIDRTAKRVAGEVTDHLMLKLSTLGLNVEKPEEQRAELEHLRRWKSSVELAGRSGVTAFMVTIVGSMLTAIWYGASYMMTMKR